MCVFSHRESCEQDLGLKLFNHERHENHEISQAACSCGSWLLSNKAQILPHTTELKWNNIVNLPGFQQGVKSKKKARQKLPRQTITTKGEWRNMF